MTYLISLNYNSSQYTIEFLQSLAHVKTDYKLILVDNHSIPEDFELLKSYINQEADAIYISQDIEHFQFNPQIRILLVKEDQNLGFAAGNNIGIQIARNQPDFEAVALINNDTEVEPNFLDEILNYRKQNRKADLIGCRIYFGEPKDVILYDGGKYFKHSTRAVHENQNKHISQILASNEPRQTEFITGCFMYISKHCLDTIGLLNDTLFMYAEDLEYCIRAVKKGLLLYYVPTAVIRHKIVQTSSPFAAYWGTRNRFKVAKLHSSLFDRFYTLISFIVTRIPRYAIWLFKGRTDLIKAQAKGFVDGLKK